MQKYLFVLGRDPELSLLEIASYFDARKTRFKILEHSKRVAAVEGEGLNPDKIVKDLGGVAKIGEVVENLDSYNLYSGRGSKIKYSISNYSGEDIGELKEYLKDRFRQERLKAAYKKSQRGEPFLSPSEAIKHKLIEEGVELLVHKGRIAKTVAVFDPNEYKVRDLQRPRQDPLLAISLRLAKILINLSGARPGKLLLDPFCGIGTILQEANLMGIDAAGLDINKKSLDDARQNLEWIQKKYKTQSKFKLVHGDATSLSRSIKGKVDCIATEPDLGPLLKKKPTLENAKNQIKTLQKTYIFFVAEAKKALKKDGRIALIVPRFRTWNNRLVLMDFSTIAENSGLRPYSALKEVKLPVIYKTPKGKIEREIWVLEQNL